MLTNSLSRRIYFVNKTVRGVFGDVQRGVSLLYTYIYIYLYTVATTKQNEKWTRASPGDTDPAHQPPLHGGDNDFPKQ